MTMTEVICSSMINIVVAIAWRKPEESLRVKL